jgi:hypothetical protein
MKPVATDHAAKQCQFYLWDKLNCNNPAYKTITAPDSNNDKLESYSFCDLHFEQMAAMMEEWSQ